MDPILKWEIIKNALNIRLAIDIGLVWFYSILTIVGNLMPNSFLCI